VTIITCGLKAVRYRHRQNESGPSSKSGADVTARVYWKSHRCNESNARFKFRYLKRRNKGSLNMRMTLRTEECRRRAALCAEKALCTLEEEVRRTFAELAEQWRALAEQAAYLEQYHTRY
jgi:hypothetical protein